MPNIIIAENQDLGWLHAMVDTDDRDEATRQLAAHLKISMEDAENNYMFTNAERVPQNPRFPVGTQFVPRGKIKTLCTVTDFLVTYNLDGEIHSTHYVASHVFMGQTVVKSDVAESTIARGLVEGTPKPA